MAFQLDKIIRQHIKTLKPYASARDEYTGNTGIFLDANENPYGTPGIVNHPLPLHRYPDPHQVKLKKRIAEIKEIDPDYIFLGNGSDEAIDLIIRAFCNPREDNIVINSPTYGMYQVVAEINEIEVREVMLTPDFQLDDRHIEAVVDAHTKIIFFCSPNNPTANLLSRKTILSWVKKFEGLIVIDEAYIDFADTTSCIEELRDLPNVIVLQTLSKAWGMASLRLGMAFASPEILAILNKIKPPYNVNGLTQLKALEVLENPNQKQKLVNHIIEQRKKLSEDLQRLTIVEHVYPSDANFLFSEGKRSTIRVSLPHLGKNHCQRSFSSTLMRGLFKSFCGYRRRKSVAYQEDIIFC
jgi:histidinol-phosphate aminotransferase